MASVSHLPHLRAAGAAVALIFTAAVTCSFWAISAERRYLNVVGPEVFPLKNQGSAFQVRTFERKDALPIYGSSELVKSIPDKASEFFKGEPTDFFVVPVGKAGTTALIMLQKIASAGPGVKGHKVAISLSSSWFFEPQIKAHYYAGNFSPLHASSIAYDFRLSFPLRQEIARRMVEYPDTLARCPVAGFGLEHLAGDTPWDRFAYYLSVPLGKLEETVLRVQDHVETLIYLHSEAKDLPDPGRHPLQATWKELIRRVTEYPGKHTHVPPPPPDEMVGTGDPAFLENLGKAQEWQDLELLMRGLKELGARPLILSMPINGQFYDSQGVSANARQVYYTKLRELCAKYQFPLVDFESHDQDPEFLNGYHDHLSEKGWMFFDRTLNDFYHNRKEFSQK